MKKYIACILLFAITGCSKILGPEPQGEITLDKLFENETGAITAVTGAYQPLLSGSLYNGLLFSTISLADDDNWTWRAEPQPDIYTVDPSSNFLGMWDALYTGITRCNTIIARSPSIEFSSNEIKNAVNGQAYFLRALYYFHLVRIFGRAPMIVDEIKVRSDAEQPRAAIEDIYKLIKDDLTKATSLLPETYSGSGTGFQTGMATRYAAFALLAMVHLELEEWGPAANAADTVINSQKYSLHPDFSMNFFGKAENGAESIFEVQFGGVNGGTTSVLSSAMAPPAQQGLASPVPTDQNFSNYATQGNEGRTGALGGAIVQAFEPGDSRFNVTFANYGLANFLDASQPVGSLVYINKYYNPTATPGLSTYNFPLIRFSEMYLIRAEALNEISAGNATAQADLEMVRQRAGLGALSSDVYADQNLLRQAIRKERRVELCFEVKRYFDLNRWGLLRTTLGAQQVAVPQSRTIVHPVTNKEYHLFPIPETELINNPNLSGDQNPGY